MNYLLHQNNHNNPLFINPPNPSVYQKINYKVDKETDGK